MHRYQARIGAHPPQQSTDQQPTNATEATPGRRQPHAIDDHHVTAQRFDLLLQLVIQVQYPERPVTAEDEGSRWGQTDGSERDRHLRRSRAVL
jgi:hypothetical protein